MSMHVPFCSMVTEPSGFEIVRQTWFGALEHCASEMAAPCPCWSPLPRHSAKFSACPPFVLEVSWPLLMLPFA